MTETENNNCTNTFPSDLHGHAILHSRLDDNAVSETMPIVFFILILRFPVETRPGRRCVRLHTHKHTHSRAHTMCV